MLHMSLPAFHRLFEWKELRFLEWREFRVKCYVRKELRLFERMELRLFEWRQFRLVEWGEFRIKCFVQSEGANGF